MSRSTRRLMLVLLAFALVVVVSMTTILIITPVKTVPITSSTPTTAQAPQHVTTPNPTYAALAGDDPTGPDLAAYAAAHQDATFLGQAITPELPQKQSIVQLFQSVVLSITRKTGMVAPLPIVSQLITAHAAIPLVANGAQTYADLVGDTSSSAQVVPPANWQPTGAVATVGIFVALGKRGNTAVGHYIPPYFATYLIQFTNWQALVGTPLTEALKVPLSGGTPPAYIQAFGNALLVALPGSGSHAVSVAPRMAGLDWLSIFGRPAVQLVPQVTVRVTAATTITASPGGSTAATFTSPFTARVRGDAAWVGTTLWYHIAWQNLLETRDGWLPADAVAFSVPTTPTPESADADALAPQLASYLNGLGDDAGLLVYVPSQNRTYAYNADQQFETASVIKVVILITLLNYVEGQHRALTSDEQSEAAAMIEESDNDAAQALYNEVGFNDGIAAYMASIGINHLTLTLGGFGTSQVLPQTMIHILEDLRTASILTPADCQYALSLMGQIASDEQMGLGDTAPPGATVQMKDGYGLEDDGLNVMVTVGIVTYQGHVYDVALFTRREQTVQQGIDYVNTICQAIALALVGQK